MSVLVGSHVGRGGGVGWARYCLRLDLSEEARRKAVPVVISDLGDDPFEIGMNAELLIEGTTRKNLGESLVLSFPAHEMDINNPEHQQRVAELLYEVMKRAAPDSPAVVAVHTDSEGGMLHAHGLLLNHNMKTGRSNQQRMDIKHLRRLNDQLMREEGLEVCNQKIRSGGRTWQEVMQDRKDTAKATDELAAANPDAAPVVPRVTIEDVVKTPTRQTSREFFRQEIDEAVADVATRCVPKDASVDTLGNLPAVPLEKLQETLSERNISMRILPDNGHGETLTFGAVDDDGEPVMVSRKSRSKKAPEKTSPVAAKGTQLGTGYSPDVLRERMQEALHDTVQMQLLHGHLRDRIDELIEDAADRMDTVKYPGPPDLYWREAVETPGNDVWIGPDGIAWHGHADSPLRHTATDGKAAKAHTDDLGEEYTTDRIIERVEEAYNTRQPDPSPRPQGGGIELTEGEKVKAADKAFLKKQSTAAAKTKTGDIDFGD